MKKVQCISLGLLMTLMLALEARGCNFTEDSSIGNCKCLPGFGAQDRSVSCSCSPGQKLEFTYENMEENLIPFEAMEFRVENCQGEVILDDGIVEYFPYLKKLVLSNITNLEVRKEALIFTATGNVTIQDVELVTLQPGSISLVGDGYSAVTIDRSLIRSKDQPANSPIDVSHALVKCGCKMPYQIGYSPAFDDIKAAMNCIITDQAVTKNNCNMPKELSSSSSAVNSGILIVLVSLLFTF